MGLFCQRKGFLLDVVLGLRIIGPEAKLGSLKRLTLPGGVAPLESPSLFQREVEPMPAIKTPHKEALAAIPADTRVPIPRFYSAGKRGKS